MRKPIILIGLIALTFALAVSAQGQDFNAQAAPANPNANASARAILDYLASLPNQPQGRVISGQFGAYGSGENYASASLSLQRVFDQTGQWPGMTGMDCMMEDGMNEVVRYLTDKWNDGYLVNLSCHFKNPWTGGGSSDVGGNGNLRNLITPGAPGNAAWISTLDTLAAHLQTLQSRGVVVIWRPLHENNGPWFWWGDKPPADFIALWQHMFSYFTNVKGLNNLLWAYSPNYEWDQWAPDVLINYPGANYVDIVGIDKYMSCNGGSAENPIDLSRSYNDLVSTGKPIGLLELGLIPASEACSGVNPYPYRWDFLIRDIKASYPRIVMFQAWEYVWQLGRHTYRGLPELMADPWVLARQELPNFRNGSVVIPTLQPTATYTSNLISNGSFSSGLAGWVPFGGVTAQVSGGVLEMVRAQGSEQAVVSQNTSRTLPINTGLEVRVDIGNSSSARKRVMVLVHDGDWSDLQACSYWIAPFSPLRTYRVMGATSENWSATHLSIYNSTADDLGWVRIDNVSLTPNPAAPAAETTCIEPDIAAPSAAADGPNLISNGQFSANQLAPWYAYGMINTQIVNTYAGINRLSGLPQGAIVQNTSSPIGVSRTVEVRFSAANPSPQRKRVLILLHDGDFSDLRVCSFWLRPNLPSSPFVIRTTTTEAWSNASLSIYPSIVDTSAALVHIDNITMRERPGLSVKGTECYSPGSSVASEPAMGVEAEALQPTLEPTATPFSEVVPPSLPLTEEVPVLPTATALEAPVEAPPSAEGAFSEQPPVEDPAGE